MALALGVDAFALSILPANALSRPLLVLSAALALAWVAIQPRGDDRDDLLPALAVLIAGVGLMLVTRLSADLGRRQEIGMLVSLALVVVLRPVLESYRRWSQVKYLWVLLSIALFAVVAIAGTEVNGAKLWLRFAGVSFQPVELIKLFLVFFLAAYLAERGEVIAQAAPWRLRASLRYLGPLFLGWGTAMAILVLQHDVGMAVLFLGVFVIMLYAGTRRLDLVLGSLAVFAAAALIAARHFAYLRVRIDVWLHPFADPLGSGYQALMALFSLAAGGLFGTGLRLGHPAIPDVATDYIYAAWSEEAGLLGACILLALYAVLIWRAFGVARRRPDLYSKLLVLGLASLLGLQIFVIVGGVVGLLPLTGITLPFISYGGSSLVANFLLVDIVWIASGLGAGLRDPADPPAGGATRLRSETAIP
ncbi:MAG: FtsW/RodA/SpoVE family cell cycle protein [bacterium]|nr:FtsW/RodA/SpoVE family cell cycle protein [bacterium]